MLVDKERRMTSLYIRPELILGLILVCLTLAVYVQVREFDFCNYDDDTYVYQNPWVRNGFSAGSVAWAFTSMHGANWHPLTWLSHMADSQLYGMNAGSHHLTSVILHVLNTLLLFAAFCRMTGMRWQSFFLAAVFALHPLHVESVAWVAERKDVLSTFFMLLALNAYVRYAATPTLSRYLPVLGLFICGLLSKSMVVTFPVLLLLLDYWPLGRLRYGALPLKTTVVKLLAEKAPLFACAALSTAVSLGAQFKGGAVMSLATAPPQLRLANALVSYCYYLKDMVAPFRLSLLYPFPQEIPVAAVVLAGAALSAITLWVIGQRSRRPWLAVGWLWYLVTLLPVIGIIKIGLQSRADRYMYVPLIGIGIAVIWTAAALLEGSRRSMALGILCGSGLVCVLTALSYQQVCHWRNSIVLYEHVLSATENNFIAHNNLAGALIREGRVADAVNHCRLSLKINPRYLSPYLTLGSVFSQQGDLPRAVQSYRQALELKPDFFGAHNYLGLALAKQGNAADALKHFSLAIKYKPDFAEAHNNMGNVLLSLNKPAEARDQFLRALQINPAFAEAYNNLGNAYAIAQDFDRALANYRQAARLLPDNPDIYCNLGKVYASKGILHEAVLCFRTAVQLNPAAADARSMLAEALQRQQAGASP